MELSSFFNHFSGLIVGTEFLLLFFTSCAISSGIFVLIYRVSHSTKIAALGLFFIMLPGVLVHEFAHMIMARLLMLHTGRMYLFPKIDNEFVKLGSIQVEKSDRVRQLLVGVAPIIAGTLVIIVLSNLPSLLRFSLYSWQSILLGIGFFVIANTMFSSRKDMEGALSVGIVICILMGLVWLLFPVVLTNSYQWIITNPTIQYSGSILAQILIVPVIINSIFALLFSRVKKMRVIME